MPVISATLNSANVSKHSGSIVSHNEEHSGEHLSFSFRYRLLTCAVLKSPSSLSDVQFSLFSGKTIIAEGEFNITYNLQYFWIVLILNWGCFSFQFA